MFFIKIVRVIEVFSFKKKAVFPTVHSRAYSPSKPITYHVANNASQGNKGGHQQKIYPFIPDMPYTKCFKELMYKVAAVYPRNKKQTVARNARYCDRKL